MSNHKHIKPNKGNKGRTKKKTARKMPLLRKKVVAILCSDIHLTLKPPVWRSQEPDWFAAMARPLTEIDRLAIKYDCPVLCAGDIFDRWNCLPELINFAIDNLPENLWAVPGQHDLPWHNHSNIRQSAYWTLIEAGTIKNLNEGRPIELSKQKIRLYGFPWDCKVQPLDSHKDNIIHIAVVHEYNWIPNKSYPKATQASRLTKKRTNFKGWDIVCLGDNHKGFIHKIGNTTFFNCGTLMRRKSDEENYKPWIGLVTADKDVIPHYLDTSEDVVLAPTTSKECPGINLNTGILFKQLEALGKDSLDFTSAIKHYLHKHNEDKAVKRLIRESIEGS